MGAIQKPLTRIKEYPRRDVTFREIEILPDLLQTRATLDMRVVKVYSRSMAEGSVFPPVLVFETPDGRMLLADGFHRVAARKSLGFRNVNAVIRPGTVQDAILYGIEANFDPDNIREVTAEDRMHAAAIMIRDEVFRGWSDAEISRRCGVSASTVRTLRLRLRDAEGVPLPEQIMKFTDGRPTGKAYPYFRRRAEEPLRVSGNPRDGFRTRVDGKAVHLGTDAAAAGEAASRLAARERERSAVLRTSRGLQSWLAARGLLAAGRPVAEFGGLTLGNAVVFPVPDADLDALLGAVGRAVLARAQSADVRRVVLAGFFGSLYLHGATAVRLAQSLPEPIEFMTPDELVAEFGGKEPDEPEPPAE